MSDEVQLSEDDARDLAAQLTDDLITRIDKVRSMTTDRALLLAKALVYGVVIVLAGLVLVLLVFIMLFRFVDAYLPPAESSWSTWLLFGTVFTVGGVVVWTKRGRLVPTS